MTPPPNAPHRGDLDTWATVLLVAAGCLAVSALSECLLGLRGSAGVDAGTAGVFAATARALHRRVSPTCARAVAGANVLLLVALAGTIVAACIRWVEGAAGPSHPVFSVGLAIQAALQVAVTLMTLESLRRVAPGMRRAR